MVKINPRCSIQGDRFSPSRVALTGVKFKEAHEPGEIGQLGIYRDKPTPYGTATISVAEKSGDWGLLDKILDILENNIDSIREAGAEDVILDCDLFHDEQCNFEFTREQLGRIYALNVFFTVSCRSNDME